MPYSPIAGLKACLQKAAWHSAWGKGKVVRIRELSRLLGSKSSSLPGAEHPVCLPADT